MLAVGANAPSTTTLSRRGPHVLMCLPVCVACAHAGSVGEGARAASAILHTLFVLRADQQHYMYIFIAIPYQGTPGAPQEVEREVEEADAGGRKRKRRVHAVEYCYEPELEGVHTCTALHAC